MDYKSNITTLTLLTLGLDAGASTRGERESDRQPVDVPGARVMTLQPRLPMSRPPIHRLCICKYSSGLELYLTDLTNVRSPRMQERASAEREGMQAP